MEFGRSHCILTSEKLNRLKKSATLLGSFRERRTQGKLVLPRLKSQMGNYREGGLPEQRLTSRNHHGNQ